MQPTKIPVICPSCSGTLHVSELSCPSCTTRVSGHYAMPALLRLTPEEQNFVVQFFLSSGSLKEMASQMGVSYPTMRNRLDDLIEKVKQLNTEEQP